MEVTLQKTITFLLFIGIGFLLKLKFKGKDELNGIKKIILNLALPATIFIALLGIDLDTGLILLPVLAFLLNICLFLIFPYILPLLGIQKDTPKYRTTRLLAPSLAPGLSCFPFVLEFLGEEYLAKAAMADLGNKVFVLIILYIIAMNWHLKKQSKTTVGKGSRLKSLFITMISEPVNLFIIAALILVSMGFTMETLPIFLNDTLSRLSVIMTPLVLLFIGLAVKIKRKQLVTLLSMLFLRAGLVALLCCVFISLTNISAQGEILLLLAFGLSACSFWPFAHISAVDYLESEIPSNRKTFNTGFAINILALSFPLSTILVLGVLSSGKLFSGALPVFVLGMVLSVLGLLPAISKKVIAVRNRSYKEKVAWIRYRTTATETL